MRVIETQVRKIRIEDLQDRRLDPVEVIVENYQEGSGKVIITCWGESWTGYWGSMGGTIEEFFQRVSNDYLIDKMSDYRSTIPDEDQDADFIKRMVIKQRRVGAIDKDQARSAWGYVEGPSLDRHTLFNGYTPEVLRCLDGIDEPWYLDWPTQVNHKYDYLSRILDVVREVFAKDISNEN